MFGREDLPCEKSERLVRCSVFRPGVQLVENDLPLVLERHIVHSRERIVNDLGEKRYEGRKRAGRAKRKVGRVVPTGPSIEHSRTEHAEPISHRRVSLFRLEYEMLYEVRQPGLVAWLIGRTRLHDKDGAGNTEIGGNFGYRSQSARHGE
jgi:hypothetical protein